MVEGCQNKTGLLFPEERKMAAGQANNAGHLGQCLLENKIFEWDWPLNSEPCRGVLLLRDGLQSCLLSSGMPTFPCNSERLSHNISTWWATCKPHKLCIGPETPGKGSSGTDPLSLPMFKEDFQRLKLAWGWKASLNLCPVNRARNETCPFPFSTHNHLELGAPFPGENVLCFKSEHEVAAG